MDAPDDAGRPLLDPNTLSADGTVAVSGMSVSEDGVAARLRDSGSGSDWQTWRVRDTATGTDLDDVVEWAKSAGAAWRNDKSGFYYGRRSRRPRRRVPGGQRAAPDPLPPDRHAQRDDEMVFASPDQPDWYPAAGSATTAGT